MNDMRRRLIACFTAVFRQLEEGDVPKATVTSVEGWDSLATISLITVIEEEFQIRVRPQDAEELGSFDGALRYLEDRTAGAAC